MIYNIDKALPQRETRKEIEFAAHPQDVTSPVGGQVVLSCAVLHHQDDDLEGSSEPVRISWQKDGMSLHRARTRTMTSSTTSTVEKTSNSSGAGGHLVTSDLRISSPLNESRLHFYNLGPADDGQYRCVAATQAGSQVVYSRSAHLRVEGE